MFKCNLGLGLRRVTPLNLQQLAQVGFSVGSAFTYISKCRQTNRLKPPSLCNCYKQNLLERHERILPGPFQAVGSPSKPKPKLGSDFGPSTLGARAEGSCCTGFLFSCCGILIQDHVKLSFRSVRLFLVSVCRASSGT